MKAKVTVAAFFVNCPACDSSIEAPNGSFMWAVNEKAPTVFQCPSCETALSLPVQYARMVA